MIPSNRPSIAIECKATMPFIEDVMIIDSNSFSSLSKLVNLSMQKSPTEIVIFCNDICRPHMIHFDKILNLVHRGFGVSSLHAFDFFGFKKEIIRKVGFFDERYLGNKYLNYDYNLRLKEADIAFYQSEEIPCINLPSIWKDEKGDKEYFEKKWECTYPVTGANRKFPETSRRRMKEEDYQYDLDFDKDAVFLKFSNSIIV